FTLETIVAKRCDVLQPAARLGNQRISRAIIGIGALDELIALGDPHNDVATVSSQSHSNEAGRLWKVHVVKFLLKLFGEQFGELVLTSFAHLVGKWEIAGVSANPQDPGIDQLNR